jgi:hypothetical protein
MTPAEKNKNYFKKEQKFLLKLANTEGGRFLLGIKNKFPITKIFPNGWVYGEGRQRLGTFYTYEMVTKILLPVITRMQIIHRYDYSSFLHFADLQKNKHLPQIYLTTTNYPSGGGDGNAFEINSVYATARNASSASNIEVSTASTFVANDLNGSNYMVGRIFFPTDTSGIDDSATISSANFNFKWASIKDAGNTFTCKFVQQNQASTSTITNTDFATFGSTSGGETTDFNTWGTDYTSTSLNSTGLGWISKTGFTKLGLRATTDIDNSAPTARSYAYITMSDAGEATAPYLQVTYTVNVEPNAPTNTTPADEAENQIVNPVLVSSAFSDDDVGDTHKASQWQVAKDNGYSDTIWDSGTDTTNLTTTTIDESHGTFGGTLTGDTALDFDTFYWHIRHQDNNDAWSNYSTTTSFDANPPPASPSNVSPADEATDVGLNPDLQGSAFSDAGDSHKSSTWQVATDVGFLDVVWSASQDETNLTTTTVDASHGAFGGTLTGETALECETTYYWRVKYYDEGGANSGYSATTSFTTEACEVEGTDTTAQISLLLRAKFW